MKLQGFVYLLACVFTISCNDKAPLTEDGMVSGPTDPVLKPCGTCIVHLKITEYYRNSENEWCVSMRIFRNDGGPLPEAGGGYQWFWDTDACDGVDNFSLWPHSTDTRRVCIDGISDPNSPLSRFKFYVSTSNWGNTPNIGIGRDMREEPITGCGACTDAVFQLPGNPCLDP